MKNEIEFKFGDYAIIEQKRHGVPNEMFVHKVVGQLRSNTWVDVPVRVPATEALHGEMEDICLCICCGIDETEVRRYRVKDMRRHSPVSLVADEKRGSTITQQAVNELIQSLESAGELSIKETKVMALAKAFKQLAAENVVRQEFVKICFRAAADGASLDGSDIQEIGERLGLFGRETYQPVLHGYICGYEAGEDSVYVMKSAPATDRIVAGIKADGVDEFAAHLRANDNGASVCKMIALGADDFAKQLREGADK